MSAFQRLVFFCGEGGEGVPPLGLTAGDQCSYSMLHRQLLQDFAHFVYAVVGVLCFVYCDGVQFILNSIHSDFHLSSQYVSECLNLKVNFFNRYHMHVHVVKIILKSYIVSRE